MNKKPINEQSGPYTLQQFLKFLNTTHGRYELHEGYPILMTPASPRHEEVVLNLGSEIRRFLKGGPCRIFGSNLAVYLPFKPDTPQYYLPDISVICDSSKLKQDGCYGAPDLVVEVLSPNTARNDRLSKYHWYERSGVREYWIVDSNDWCIEKYVLTAGEFVREDVYDSDHDLVSTIFPEINIHLHDIFFSLETD